MVWGDGERLGADHTVTFKLGDGEPWQRKDRMVVESLFRAPETYDGYV